jgi:uncharacterized protein (TIGR01777 family)
MLIEKLSDFEATKPLDYVVNLAGEPIAAKRWNVGQKVKLWESRVDLTHRLVNWIKQRPTAPKALISGSAVGWYGDGEAQILTEQSSAVNAYTHTLCHAWETEALALTSADIRVCISRTGLVLSKHGGFLSKLTLPFKLGLGARLGNGQQYMSWIHLDDMVTALLFLIADNHQKSSLPHGIFNLTSPNPISNRQFNQTFATQLNRCCCLVMPSPVLKLLLGEMAQLLLAGQRAVPQRLTDHGFIFRYPKLAHALADIMS